MSTTHFFILHLQNDQRLGEACSVIFGMPLRLSLKKRGEGGLFLCFNLRVGTPLQFWERLPIFNYNTFDISQCKLNSWLSLLYRWGYSGTSDRIRFCVNRKIYIVGFGLYGAIIGPADYQVNIQVGYVWKSNFVLHSFNARV